MNLLKTYTFEIAISIIGYVGFFYLTGFINHQFEVNKSVSWFFPPAGLRIFFTLIFIYSGAVGLCIASLIINFISFSDLDNCTMLGVVIISGLAPLLSRLFVIHHFQVDRDLHNLTTSQLVMIIFTFALFSSGLHQLWFMTRGLNSGSWTLFITMFFGDILGSIVFIAMIKYGIAYLRRRYVRQS